MIHYIQAPENSLHGNYREMNEGMWVLLDHGS